MTPEDEELSTNYTKKTNGTKKDFNHGDTEDTEKTLFFLRILRVSVVNSCFF